MNYRIQVIEKRKKLPVQLVFNDFPTNNWINKKEPLSGAELSIIVFTFWSKNKKGKLIFSHQSGRQMKRTVNRNVKQIKNSNCSRSFLREYSSIQSYNKRWCNWHSKRQYWIFIRWLMVDILNNTSIYRLFLLLLWETLYFNPHQFVYSRLKNLCAELSLISRIMIWMPLNTR